MPGAASLCSRVAAVTHIAGKAAAVLQLTLLMLQGRDENRKDKIQKTGLCLSVLWRKHPEATAQRARTAKGQSKIASYFASEDHA